jgi:hypothetical protein
MSTTAAGCSRAGAIFLEWFVGWTGASYFANGCFAAGFLKLLLTLFTGIGGYVWWWVDWIRSIIGKGCFCTGALYGPWDNSAIFVAVVTVTLTLAFNATWIVLVAMAIQKRKKKD